jgi:nitrogen regulatory protein P-II 2
MNFTPLKLITIIAEDDLEERLIREIKTAGATGYTLSKARGEGSRRARISEWEGENIRIEALVSQATATRIAETLAARYLDRFGVVFYTATVEVLRPSKFASGQGTTQSSE